MKYKTIHNYIDYFMVHRYLKESNWEFNFYLMLFTPSYILGTPFGVIVNKQDILVLFLLSTLYFGSCAKISLEND